MFFSELHVQLLARGILNPGEQLVSRAATFYRPWWALGFIQRQHLVLATDQRVILVEHRLQFFPFQQALTGVESIPWSQVSELRVSGFPLMKKSLRIKGIGDRGQANHKLALTNTIGVMGDPVKNNKAGAAAIAQTFLQARNAPQLPQYSQAPQPYSQPPMPMINAPGYQSMPPSAPTAQYGAYGEPPRPY